jgi:hypothetical protein
MMVRIGKFAHEKSHSFSVKEGRHDKSVCHALYFIKYWVIDIKNKCNSLNKMNWNCNSYIGVTKIKGMRIHIGGS